MALALLVLPVHGLLPFSEQLRWFIPAALMLVIAPWFFYRWRWQNKDATRALVRVDKTLRLDERATTAWELSARAETSATAQLVIKQAAESLLAVEPRSLSPRQWNWPSYTVIPLFVLWLPLLWFDADRPFLDRSRPNAPRTLAHKLLEFSRELQESAKSEGLRESLKAGQELENLARKNIDAKTDDEPFKKELAGVAKKLEAGGKPGADANPFSAGESQQSLRDLRAELEAARDLLDLPGGDKGARELPQQWLDRLASMPEIKKQFDKESGQGFGQNDLKSFLDRLERQATNELDRRALIDAQQFLEQMMKSGQGKSESSTQTVGRGEKESLDDDGVREKRFSNLPGKEPGKKDDGVNSLPELRGGAQTQVKGFLGEGDSSVVIYKGKPTPGKSELSEQEVIANYRRQAEQELNSERVPEALKETIRNYFLSLGGGNR